MIVVIVIYSEFNLSPLVRSPGTWADGSTEGIWEFKSYILPVISKCYLRGVRDDDKSQSVSRHHRQLRDGAESYHRCTALRGRGTIITMTSEGDKYCARTDCGILERGSLKTKEEDEEEEVEGGRGRKKKPSHQFFNLPRGKMHNHIISHTTWFKGGQNKFVRFPWVCQSVEGAAGESLGCIEYETIMIIPLKHSEAIWQPSLGRREEKKHTHSRQAMLWDQLALPWCRRTYESRI